MAQKRKITDKNLYELLEVLSSATEQEIKKAYRKKALKCHPDKNPDNPKAAELFHELSEALEILTGEKAKEAYDRSLKAKEQAKERLRELDSKRRKLKEDLERREQAAKEEEKARAAAKKSYNATVPNLSEEEALQKEIERLRKEGSRALQEEQELIRQQILKEQQGKYSFLSSEPKEKEGPRLKIKWTRKEGGDYPRNHADLLSIYSNYGKVTTLVVGKKCAIVEFENQYDADQAFEGEVGNSEIQIEWLSKGSSNSNMSSASSSSQQPNAKPLSTTPSVPGGLSAPLSQPMNPTSFADFEAMILGRLSAAAAAQKQNNSSSSNN